MCSRLERIQQDVNVVIKRCETEKECPFSNFRYADANFTFTYSQGSKKISYSVNVSDDYPDNTYVSNSENRDDGLITMDPIPVIFQKIVSEMRPDDVAGSCPPSEKTTDNDSEETSEGTSSERDSDAPEEDSEGEEDDYGGQEEHVEEENAKHPQLEADLQAVRDLKGASAVTLREYPGFDDVDIDLHIDVSFLDEETALCWGVMRKEPVTIRLNCSLTQYLDGAVPKIEVFQVSLLKDRFGLGHQIKKVMQTFVTAQWEGTEGTHEATPVPDRCTFGFKTSDIDAKSMPTRHSGFLVQTIEYAEKRIPVLNEFCVICDEPHVSFNGPMLRPYVCEAELCIFAFQTLGVMNKVTDVIATGAQVVDLLLSMARAALASNRRDLIFDPYPSVVDPGNPEKLALDPKSKDYDRVNKAFCNLPCIQQMTQTAHSEMKKQMDTVDSLSLPLLQWVISSNRSHIAKLTADKQLEFMHTPHQFLLLSSSPAKEAKFREARTTHGSTFVFHGSNIENWHSIMRKGLVVASNTKYQLHGAAYGVGIYLSPTSSLSFSYSGISGYRGDANDKDDNTVQKDKTKGQELQFLNSRNLKCIALCEVITSPDLRKNGTIWVHPNADYVCTRFFFVYEDGQSGDQDINTQDPKISEQILKIVTSRHHATKT